MATSSGCTNNNVEELIDAGPSVRLVQQVLQFLSELVERCADVVESIAAAVDLCQPTHHHRLQPLFTTTQSPVYEDKNSLSQIR